MAYAKLLDGVSNEWKAWKVCKFYESNIILVYFIY